MDHLFIRYTQSRKNGIKIEYERSYTGVWNTIPVEDAIKMLKHWTKELEKEFKRFKDA